MTPGRDLPSGLRKSLQPTRNTFGANGSVNGRAASSVGIENIGKLSNYEVVNEDKCFEYS